MVAECSATPCLGYEILSPGRRIAVLDKGWRRIVSEIGVQFAKARGRRAVPQGRPAGGTARSSTSTPSSCSRQVARAPREVRRPGQEPGPQACTIGGDEHGVRRRPTARRSCAEGDVRREANHGRLPPDGRGWPSRSPSWTRAGGVICEPNDAPLDSRQPGHDLRPPDLHRQRSTWANVVSGPNAADTIRMTEILFGGRKAIEAHARHHLADQLQTRRCAGTTGCWTPQFEVLRGRPAR